MSKVILLIDDDDDDKALFEEALAAAHPGYTCLLAGDGKEALTRLSDSGFASPSVLFIDVNMPEMDGWEVVSEIKKLPARRDIPVIMYSTSSHERDRELAAQHGALCLITKPDSYKTLKELLAFVGSHLGTPEDMLLIKDYKLHVADMR